MGQEVKDNDQEKQEMRLHFQESLRLNSKLTEPEIQELLDYEFNKRPRAIQGQLRYWYLKVKSDTPQTAEQLLADLPVIKEDSLVEADIVALCQILYKHISGFVIYFGGKGYTGHMKITYTVYYTDGTSGMIEFNKPSGVHPNSTGAAFAGLVAAEKSGKIVARIGRSCINPFSEPGGPPVIDEDMITRAELVERIAMFSPGMFEEFEFRG